MEQLESLLTCPICLDRYRNPKLLPCQHSFCMEPCMEGLVDYVRRQVKCPECRAEHRIPYQGVQAFPTNVTLQRFLELHIELTGELPDPTSNQIMERCQVCSEKSYCIVCTHCDKKVCPECKEAHMDVLKREISRISNQVRRVLHRLEDALSLTEKNSLHLQQNSLSVVEEIDDVYRRLAKALKDRAEFLKHEVERYLQTELRNLSSFKHNMDQELSNIQSNCDLVDKYMQAESTLAVWEDAELMDTKDIFLKTMEFIRNFEYEPGDYARRVKFLVEKDPNTLAVSLSSYGDLYLPTTNLQACILGGNRTGGDAGGANSSSGHGSKAGAGDAGSGLMRSKSDHRLTMQYRGQDYDDAATGRTSPVFGRKFGERKERAGGRKHATGADYDPSLDPDLAMLEVPTKSRFRSRFARHLQDSFEDSDASGGGRSGDRDGLAGRKDRERVLDTEDVTRGPLSGITKLIDSPRVIQRLQETETAGTKLSSGVGVKPADKTVAPVAVAPVAAPTPVAPWRAATARQVSQEDDEIAKQKKMNKEGAAAVNARAAAATPNAPVRRQPSNEPKSPPVTAPTRTSTERGNQLLESGAGDETAAATAAALRQRTSQPRKLSPERVIPKNTRSESSDSGRSETSSGSSRNTNTGAVFSAEEVKQRYLSKSSDPTPQSRKDSTTVCPNGPNPTSASATSGNNQQTPAGAAAAAAAAAVSTSPSTNGSSSKKFQSRFLGKQPSTTVEASKESSTSSEEESDEEEEEESESESSDDGATTVKKAGSISGSSTSGGSKPTPERTSRMEKTDIGPLLAKSANARDTSRENARDALGSYSSRSRGSTDLGTSATTPSLASYRRTRDAVSRVTSPPEREVVPSRYNSSSTGASASSVSTPSNNTGGSNYGSSRYGGSSGTGSGTGSTTDYGSGLTRSRTGSSLYPSALDGLDTSSASSRSTVGDTDTSSRYNKYLNRSRHNFDDDLGVSSSLSSRPSSTGRYGDDDPTLEHHAGSPGSSVGVGGASSRIAAVKDREKRREKLAKSKSSTTIGSGGHTVSFDDEAYVIGERRGSMSRRPSIGSASGVGGIASGVSGRRKFTSTTGEIIPSNDDSASLSSWARYLKNKYGKGQSKSLDRRLSVDSGTAAIGGITSSGLGSPRSSISGPAGGNQYLGKNKLLFKFGSRGSDPGYFTWPRDVSVGPDGQIVVTDSSNHRIQVFTEQGTFISEFGAYGSADGELDCPAGVCVNRIGQFIISDRYNHRIVVLDPSGRFLRAFGSQGSADGRFNNPWGVTTDCLGFIFVCDKENNRICVFQSDGTFVGKILGLNHPHYIAVTSTNRVIVSDTNNHRIVIFDVNGHMITTFGSEGTDDGQFKFPRGIAVDETYGYIIVGDSGNNRIQIFTPDYKFLHSIGTWGCGDAEFKGMEGLAVTGSGKILVVDREQHCVKCF